MVRGEKGGAEEGEDEKKWLWIWKKHRVKTFSRAALVKYASLALGGAWLYLHAQCFHSLSPSLRSPAQIKTANTDWALRPWSIRQQVWEFVFVTTFTLLKHMSTGILAGY